MNQASKNAKNEGVTRYESMQDKQEGTMQKVFKKSSMELHKNVCKKNLPRKVAMNWAVNYARNVARN